MFPHLGERPPHIETTPSSSHTAVNSSLLFLLKSFERKTNYERGRRRKKMSEIWVKTRLFGAVPLTFQLIRLALGELLRIWLPKPICDWFYLFLLCLSAARTADTHDPRSVEQNQTAACACICVCLVSASAWYRANLLEKMEKKQRYLNVWTEELKKKKKKWLTSSCITFLND